ncbi:MULTISPECIES: cation:proton antiporter domain-containing protein [Streptomyces]|uniref:Cation:proton antiporter n=1 Tax=Streptomyces evansiae TaxID=3075535 RepID=A0ABU2QXS5_9ACTN|nr:MULTISPECIES: cation:proton antiporter [unclassified Streptomyces]MDT0407835.1 cation:proton antiporter [Streptomyces sp. DSM 41979]MDT0424184.1 cation:proton antiporter [Streptomyces sp. DSM 41859]WEH27212.1 cation:proton antiporter [Streptomyces sp. AM 3-1-1]SCD29949.1 Kef-type K+ transport system, membrane component KefB [Streptomyces sp. DfronAA-171]
MSAPDPLPHLLVAVPVVIAACRAGAVLVRRIGQPPVIGEITIGILLGPSLLGWISPGAAAWLFPAQTLPYLSVLGNIGLLCFMFLVGLELDLSALRGNSRTAVAVSQVGIFVPLALGGLLAAGMYGSFAPPGVGRLPFVLFVAVSLSITAFPVLARILTDRGLYATGLGSLAMASAAVDDVAAWCLLALVTAVSVSGSPGQAVVTVLWSLVFVAVMASVVRPLLSRLSRRAERLAESTVLAAVFTGLCVSACITQEIGIHALFGAFLFGVVTPRHSRSVEVSAARLRAFAVPLLLPLFFVSTGLNTDISLLGSDVTQWLWAGAVLAVAVLGKFGGATSAARLSGRDWRDSLSLGALMNCRGLTELIVLNLGLELGVIGPDLFTILVLMALVTTAITSPALTWFRRSAEPGPAPATGTGTGGDEALGKDAGPAPGDGDSLPGDREPATAA